MNIVDIHDAVYDTNSMKAVYGEWWIVWIYVENPIRPIGILKDEVERAVG
jgi:hypothetical protein